MEYSAEQFILNPEKEVTYEVPDEKEEISSVSSVTDPNQGLNELLARVQRESRSNRSVSSNSNQPGVPKSIPQLASIDNVLKSTQRNSLPFPRDLGYQVRPPLFSPEEPPQPKPKEKLSLNVDLEMVALGALIFFTSYGMYKCGIDLYTLFSGFFSKSPPPLPPA